MASKSIYLSGKVKWARVHKPDTAFGNTKWSILLYPDTASLDKIRELQAQGLKNVLKKDEDGYNMTFSRPTEKTFRGVKTALTPPEILDASKPLPGGGYAPLKEEVGNGSDVTVKLAYYDYPVPASPGKRGVAVRFESLRVDNLIPFQKTADFPEERRKLVEGLVDQPPMEF